MTDNNSWLVAVVAPWAVAPHPNFAQPSLHPYQVLALVPLMRLRDVDRFLAMLPDDKPSWVDDLVNFSRESVQEESIVTATPRLWGMAKDASLPYPVRMTAALFGSAAQADMDKSHVTLSEMDSLVNDPRAIAREQNALALALGHLHLAARYFESYEYGKSKEHLKHAEHYADQIVTDVGFAVSEGISWSDSEVMCDIKKFIRKCVLELTSRVEGLSGETWSKVVRSKATWNDYRNVLIAGQRDSQYVSRKYEDSVGLRSKGNTWSVTTPVLGPAWEAVLASELVADVNDYMRNREKLGQVLMLRVVEQKDPSDDVSYVKEALKLFRTSRADKSLKRALDQIHLHGPAQALISDAKLIMDKETYPSGCVVTDIMVLGAAANYLTADQVYAAIGGCLSSAKSPRGDEGRWPSDEKTCWSSISKLLETSSRDQEVADALLEKISSWVERDQNLERTLRSVLEKLDLETVLPETIQDLRSWGASRQEATQIDSLAHAAQHLGQQPEQNTDTLNGQDLPLYLVNSVDVDPTETVLEKADTICVNAIQQVVQEAAIGTLSHGGADEGELATAYALKYQRSTVWEAITELLTDSNVVRDKKSGVLERLAAHKESSIPTLVQERIAASWDTIINTRHFEMFDDKSTDTPFIAAYRAGVQLKIINREEALTLVTKLFGHPDEDVRSATADLIYDFGRTYESWEYAQLLLLQLAQDLNPTVRATAAKNLAQSSRVENSLAPLIYEAIQETLKADGIRVPIYTLYGFQSAAEEFGPSSLNASVHELIRAVESEHPARVVRQAAGLVFTRGQ